MDHYLRQASKADLVAYIGHEPSADWRPYLRDWAGYIVERDGKMVGVGCISEDDQGRLWAWVHTREALPAMLVHRGVVKVMGHLRRAGFDGVHCYRDEGIADSERWLRRLGFRPAPKITTARGKMVWKCDFLN